ncbi:MAG: flagellar basal body rod protein FlgB [SAR86 cluster bacterium]|uniref:Flagellar basal body rod protein FlgB n=1 Tax=SAR86 cluster bacterium TaxID=2030880 RepID=A0A2A5B6K4_9GAMM|nr:MAG: flagellar basal body rod protein FlgB [SAR86 cluster bacterium]
MSWIDRALGIHPAALVFRSQRSSILAANIANAATPGYKAKDYDFQNALRTYTGGRALSMKTTNENHASSSANKNYGGLLYRVPTKYSSNNNTVEAEVEQAAFSENALRYQTSLQFLNGSISGLRKAITGQ